MFSFVFESHNTYNRPKTIKYSFISSIIEAPPLKMLKMSASLSFLQLLCAASFMTFTDALSNTFLSDRVSQFETLYIKDCTEDRSPHGFYGAFFQPCEFSFYRKAGNEEKPSSNETVCTSSSSTLVGQPTPVHWLFKLQDHIEKDDWDDLSTDDIPDFDELMLWPDQCVGVTPRCYALQAPSPASNSTTDKLLETLRRLFPHEIPSEATHVQVDCRVDSMELSRVAYSLAGGAESSLPFIAAWMATLILLFVLGMSYCCFGCLALCFRHQTKGKNHRAYYAIPDIAIAGDDYITSALVDTKTQPKQGRNRTKMVELAESARGTSYLSI